MGGGRWGEASMRAITFRFIYSFEITNMILVLYRSFNACCQTRMTEKGIRLEDSYINNKGFVDVSLTVNLSKILVINQLNALILVL